MRERIRLGRSLPTSVGAVVFFAVVLLLALGIPTDARIFPIVAGTLGLALSCLQFVLDLRDARSAERGAPADESQTGEPLGSGLAPMLWLAGLVLAILLVGPVIAVPLFLAAFIGLTTRHSWLTAIVLALIVELIILGVFSLVMNSAWLPGVISGPQDALLRMVDTLR